MYIIIISIFLFYHIIFYAQFSMHVLTRRRNKTFRLINILEALHVVKPETFQPKAGESASGALVVISSSQHSTH